MRTVEYLMINILLPCAHAKRKDGQPLMAVCAGGHRQGLGWPRETFRTRTLIVLHIIDSYYA